LRCPAGSSARRVPGGDRRAQAPREDRRWLRHLEQLRTYAEPGRDPRGWLPSIAYLALVRPETLPDDGPADRDASWHPVDDLPPLALDHARIVDDGLWRLRARVADKGWFVRVAGGLLPASFTLGQAQRLYEALRCEPVDIANFRRDVQATGLLEPTGALHHEGPGRPGKLYRRAGPGRRGAYPFGRPP
jgi:8-oxo-dGTP diphosphatase